MDGESGVTGGNNLTANQLLVNSGAGVTFTGMDVGTAFEVGFMRALGRPCLCYSNQPGSYLERAKAYRETAAHHRLLAFDGDRTDTEIEDFDLAENLMIAIPARETGGGLLSPPPGDPGADMAHLGVFEKCVAQAARIINGL